MYSPHTNKLDVTFLGLRVRFDAEPQDIRDLRFFFRNYVSSGFGPPQRIVTLHGTATSGGVLSDFLNNSPGSLWAQVIDPSPNDHEYALEPERRDFTRDIAPFPPLDHPQLAGRLAVYTGAAIRTPHGHTVAILGRPYSGKTSVALTLCRTRGCSLISDSLLLLDCESGNLLSWDTPIGLRRQQLIDEFDHIAAADHRLTLSNATGPVALVHPADLLGKPNVVGGVISRLYILDRRPNLSTIGVSVVPMPELPWWHPPTHRGPYPRHIPPTVSVISTGSRHTPAEVASIIGNSADA